MAGTLVITTLSDGTNSTSATNCIQGSAKAWANYNGSTQTIRASFNVSSVTYNAVGDYSFNFTTAFADTNYTTVGAASRYAYSTSSYASNFHVATISSSQVYLQIGYEDTYSGAIPVSSFYVGLAAFGN